MELGLIGSPSEINLAECFHDHSLVAYHRFPSNDSSSTIKHVSTLEDFAIALKSQRVIWLCDEDRANEILDKLVPYLSISDIIITIDNSSETVARKRYDDLQGVQINILDCNIVTASSPIAMVGGNYFAFKQIESLFSELVGRDRYLYCGTGGSAQHARTTLTMVNRSTVPSLAGARAMLEHPSIKIFTDRIIAFWSQHGLLAEVRD